MGSPEVGGGDCRDCNDVLGFVWLYLDHEAPPTTCAELEAHLVDCQSCQRAVRFDRRFKQLVRRCAGPEPVPTTVVESLRIRVEAILRTNPPSQPA
ncbi:MAG TPA: mycothiol system anti-sigma-R factor [Actinomycetes bacterium]|jgi:mycothiol system anti-sigma-R factor|nr:mycothiol system anti-sigma-R factor [Actinomycetes bacterium]